MGLMTSSKPTSSMVSTKAQSKTSHVEFEMPQSHITSLYNPYRVCQSMSPTRERVQVG
jgi:hypothetical protein